MVRQVNYSMQSLFLSWSNIEGIDLEYTSEYHFDLAISLFTLYMYVFVKKK